MKPEDIGSTGQERGKVRPGRGRRVFMIAALIVILLIAGSAVFMRPFFGMRGRVQKILNGARWEEQRGTTLLTSLLDSLIERVMPARTWQGEYFYQEELVKLGTNAVPELIHVLGTDTSAAARRVSAKALGELSSPGTVPVLIKALGKDQDGSVREAIVEALGTLGDTNALPTLMTTLRTDRYYRVRAESVSGLGKLGGVGMVSELVAIGATETNWVVRTHLAETLGRMSDPRSVPLLVDWLRMPYPVVPPPTNFLSFSSPDEYPGSELRFFSATATALGNIGGEEAFGAIMVRWQVETNAEVRRSLCEAFGAMADARALPVLLAALNGDAELKSTVVAALGNLGDTNAVPEVLPLLGDGNKEVRRKAAEALGQIGGLACVPELMRVAEEDSTTEGRCGACAALGMIGDPRAQSVIIRALPELGDNRQEAVWALGHVGDTNAIGTLAELLSDKERETRFAAAFALAEIGGPSAADAVAAHLEDKDEYARHGKVCALAMLGRTNSLALVRTGLRAKEDWRRFSAAMALIRLGQAADAKEWEPLLADRIPSLRTLASESAAGRGIPALAALLRDSDKDLRHYAARGLVFFRDPATLPGLREACHDRDQEVRNAARVAVRCIERQTEKSGD